jgi:alkylhydroperoxidase family enzyme
VYGPRVGGEQTPRIAPGSRRQIGLLNAAIGRLSGLATGGRPPHIFTTLARHRRLFRRWLWFAAALMPRGRLPREDTELVILRVAHNAGSEYEWGHHVRIGRKAGLSREEIARVRDGAGAPGWSNRQAMLLAAADELHRDGEIGNELWGRLTAELDEVELIELCMLVGHYEMLAMTLNTLRVAPDFELEEWGR